jgi:hypothetical protein
MSITWRDQVTLYQKAKKIADIYEEKYHQDWYQVLLKGMDEHKLTKAEEDLLQSIVDKHHEIKYEKVSHRE